MKRITSRDTARDHGAREEILLLENWGAIPSYDAVRKLSLGSQSHETTRLAQVQYFQCRVLEDPVLLLLDRQSDLPLVPDALANHTVDPCWMKLKTTICSRSLGIVS